MALETILILLGAAAIFGMFGVVLGYVNTVASARAITPEEEQALRLQ